MRIYENSELMQVAKRENNTKRIYLLVNPLQGKHIPAIPSQVMELFEQLSQCLQRDCKGERLTVIGFAETATAIGAGAALGCPQAQYYIHTTREQVADEKNSLYFSEVHSHAADQYLAKANLEEMISKTDRIVFAEDEVTTGNTIKNLIGEIQKNYGGKYRLKFGVLSILNSMSREEKQWFEERQIPVIYLNSLEKADYTQCLSQFKFKEDLRIPVKTSDASKEGLPEIFNVKGKIDPRLGAFKDDYRKACRAFSAECISYLNCEALKTQRILVLGTEEFMYPALYTAWLLEQDCREVRFHASTRSPILPDSHALYPLHVRNELRSVYEKNRTTFIYNLEKYDQVIWMFDPDTVSSEGWNSMIHSLKMAGNENIKCFRWCR